MRYSRLCVVLVVLLVWPAFGQEKTYKMCFDNPIEGGAWAVVITADGEYMGACTLESFLFYRGGLAPTGFYKFGYYFHACLAAHPSEPVVAATWQRIDLMDMAGNKKIATLKPKGRAWWVAWKSAGTQVLSIDEKNTVQVFDVASKKAVQTWTLPLAKKDVVSFAVYSDRSGLLAVATEDSVLRVFEAETGKALAETAAFQPGSDFRITGLDFHPEGKLLAGCNNGQVKVWDAATLAVKHEFPVRAGGTASLIKYYAQGKSLAYVGSVGSGEGFVFVDGETNRLIGQGMVAEYDTIKAWDMAFPDGQEPHIFAATSGEMAYLCRYSAIIGKSPGVTVIKKKSPALN